jgi:hypothetical protein
MRAGTEAKTVGPVYGSAPMITAYDSFVNNLAGNLKGHEEKHNNLVLPTGKGTRLLCSNFRD